MQHNRDSITQENRFMCPLPAELPSNSPATCNLGTSYPSDLWDWGGQGGGGGEGAPKMSIEVVSVKRKACLISAHLDFMRAQRSAPPDRECSSYILS